MFVGHYAAAFGTSKLAPRPSLGLLFAAAQLPDLLWPVLLLAGIERVEIAPGDTAFTPLAFTHYPWSHSLLMVVVWGLVAGVVYGLWSRDRRGAIVIGLLVLSHWVLDAVTHRPDLPLVPGGDARVGLGLWNSLPGTLVVELALYGLGLLIHARATRGRDRVGRWGLWGLAALLVIIELGSVAGPPPPTVRALAWVALAAAVFPLLAWWVGRHRSRRVLR